jgi:putative holliday junction resolvase
MVSATRNAGTSSPDRFAPKPLRILAIDYGRRRIGLAISDQSGVIAQPLDTMKRKNRRADLQRLRDLARKNEVGAIVVGYPVQMSGKSGQMAEEAARFAARIGEALKLPVELQDERLTSWEAEQMAGELGFANKADLDSLSAAIMLREYLNEPANRRKSRRSVHG